MAELKTIPAVKARIHFGDIMKRVFKNGERFIVEKSGIPMVIIINATEYTRFIEEREERFKIIDRIKVKLPNIAAEEVEKDINETVKIIRKQRA